MKLSLLIIWILVPAMLAQVDYDDKRKCRDCENCCNNNCLSGDMRVEEQTRGIIRVSQLSNGDFIRGISGADRTPGWCKVEAVYPTGNVDNVTTYDGFTANHMVVDDDSVHQYGKKGEAKGSRLFKVATECDVAVNAAGQAFTPISTAFCPHDLSWSEYLTLMAAIRRVTDRTGFFWYFSDAFHNNYTAHVPLWKDMLHEMCLELLRCAREGECQQFEKVMTEFVREHVNKKYVGIVELVFPNMGGDVNKEEAGTISETVRPQGMRSTVLVSAVSGAIAVCTLVIIVAAILYRKRLTRKNKEMKESLSIHPQINGDDGKA